LTRKASGTETTLFYQFLIFFVKLLSTLFFFLLLTAQTCQKNRTNINPAIFGHWVHSFEEDKNHLQAYRPASYSFPLARGREGFELKENGSFVLHRIGPADGTEQINGAWKATGQNKIQISFEKAAMAPYTIQLIQVNDTLLTLKKSGIN
jgi:hypothetical protein